MRLISRKTLLFILSARCHIYGGISIYPIITMVVDSFFEIGITGDKTFVGLENYMRAFTAGGFLKRLKNTLLYIVIAVSIETAIGLLFALFFELNYKREQNNPFINDGTSYDSTIGSWSYMEIDDEFQLWNC